MHKMYICVKIQYVKAHFTVDVIFLKLHEENGKKKKNKTNLYFCR